MSVILPRGSPKTRGLTAVMAKRRAPLDDLEDFPTVPWATRALCKVVLGNCVGTVWEPAANRGYMARALGEHFDNVIATDIADYGCGYPTLDFLADDLVAPEPWIDWIITNPPFRLAEAFVHQALRYAMRGVAVFVRLQFLEGIGRFDRLFCDRPPSEVVVFSDRVTLVKGRLPGPGENRSATAYCWMVWHLCTIGGPLLRWIPPPSRRDLERPGDYAATPDDEGVE